MGRLMIQIKTIVQGVGYTSQILVDDRNIYCVECIGLFYFTVKKSKKCMPHSSDFELVIDNYYKTGENSLSCLAKFVFINLNVYLETGQNRSTSQHCIKTSAN